ncbi:inositol 2-dehydrogenase [uncultured Psychromonas sp.]|uniref:inositol 2-dehydrogenase n=1 Tax=uncultured Psychromonas sp. TaxID=173974 RepID=UPI00260CC622|nr:inositol 2-dehydrogenase [uncultured Psychromonas sp.]
MFNIALFGVGRIGRIHGQNIHDHAQTNLYSVIDPYVEGREEISEKYDAKIQTTEEAMADPNVDAICICSATHTHVNLIELAAAHGKAVFCEKPIDLDLAKVRNCLKVVEQHGTILFIAFNRRYDAHFNELKGRLSENAIGQIESLIITSRDPSAPPAEYTKISGGMYRDMTIHDFDMARYLMNEEPTSITAYGSCMVDPEIAKAGDIDTSVVVLTFASGAIATINNSRRSGYGYDQRIEVHGSKGLLTAGNINENSVKQFGDQGTIEANPEYFFLQRYAGAYKNEWNHFVEVLGGAESLSPGIDGERALALADAALESLQTNKTVTL